MSAGIPNLKSILQIFLSALVCCIVSFTLQAAEPPTVVVCTSMLREAARTALEGVPEVRVVNLLPPGNCPGHFDLSPRDLPLIQSAALLLRHDYQRALENNLRQIGADGARSVVVPTTSTLLIPENYQALLNTISEALMTRFPARRAAIERNRAESARRMARLSEEMRRLAEPWKGKPVIAAVMQREFCRALGLEVIGVIRRPEDVSPRELEGLLSRKPSAVIGNLQEGPAAAESLAARLGVPVAVLSNFPGSKDFGESYEQLMESNLKLLKAALK